MPLFFISPPFYTISDMTKKIMALLIAAICAGSLGAQDIRKADTGWFEEARFGMFVHFGPYSVLGAGEWVMQNRPVKGKDYMRLLDFFNPQKFNAEEWVKTAKDAGMKYIVLTSRHHDGFSNWDTKQSDWNIMNTPYGKDLIKQLADECRQQGMKLGFYYSTLDWMRDDYHWTTGRTGQEAGRTKQGNWRDYIDFMKAQLTELLTNYGDVAVIWFDGHWDQTDDKNRTDQSTKVDWHYPEIYAHIRNLQPGCLIANNHHLPPFPGEDYQIFERDVPGENKAGFSGQEVSELPLETCQTINRTWGFNITDDNYKSPRELIHLLVRTAGVGANLLLNVGPMPDGRIQPECVERLSETGAWMNKYGHTIYGTKAGRVKPQEWGAITAKGNTYYIHILEPETKELVLNIPGIKSAGWLNVDSKLVWKRDRKTGDVTFTMGEGLDPVDSIIEVTVK